MMLNLYFYAKNTLNSYKKDIFYFKPHPKTKFKFNSDTGLKKSIILKKKRFLK